MSVSTTLGLAVLAAVVVAGAVFLTASAVMAGGLTPGGPDDLSQTRSLGRVIADATDHPVHIIFVHGIGAEGPGTSLTFRQGLCRYVKDACPPGGGQPPVQRSERFDLGPMPDARFIGAPVWLSDPEWAGSRPFVDRYVYRGGRQAIVLDEVNWWPLLFPLKCRALLEPETRLSGRDVAHLKLCARSDAPYYPWIDAPTLANLLATPPRSGGGALLNAALKQQLMNWGLADAVIGLGPMRTYLHKAMDAAFAHALAFDGPGAADQEFVVISASLGSFVVMDAAARTDGGAPNVGQVMASTSDLYFLANQFALLELARIDGLRDPASAAETQSRSVLRAWATTPPRRRGAVEPRPRQIIAFSDPSDVLTYDVPRILDDDGKPAATVVNLYDRNEFDFLGLVADPIAAHGGHSRNAAVLRTIFGP